MSDHDLARIANIIHSHKTTIVEAERDAHECDDGRAFERVMALCQEATDKGMRESVLMSFADDVNAYVAMANSLQKS